jgi:hypothetical protein
MNDFDPFDNLSDFVALAAIVAFVALPRCSRRFTATPGARLPRAGRVRDRGRDRRPVKDLDTGSRT